MIKALEFHMFHPGGGKWLDGQGNILMSQKSWDQYLSESETREIPLNILRTHSIDDILVISFGAEGM